jgi:phage shock protein A
MSTGGGKITDALLAQLDEKKDLYARLKDEKQSQLDFIKDIREKISLASQDSLASSASSARKARGLSDVKSLEQEAEAVEDKVKALEGGMEEIQDEIKEFEDLLGG